MFGRSSVQIRLVLCAGGVFAALIPGIALGDYRAVADYTGARGSGLDLVIGIPLIGWILWMWTTNVLTGESRFHVYALVLGGLGLWFLGKHGVAQAIGVGLCALVGYVWLKRDEGS